MGKEFGIEELYAEGIGISDVPTDSISAVPESDGDTDSLLSEVQAQENLIGFLDTYDLLEKKNAADKIRMFKKISNNYGKSSKSIESWCDIQSQEAEEAAATDGAKSDDAAKKKNNIFVKMFGVIAKFFKKMFEVIKGIFSKLKSKFSSNNIQPEEEKKIDEMLKKPSDTLKKHCLKCTYTLYKFDANKLKTFADRYNKSTMYLEDLSRDMQNMIAAGKEEISKFNPSKYNETFEALKAVVSGVPGLEKGIPSLNSSGVRHRIEFAMAVNKMVKELDYEKHENENIKFLTGIEHIDKEDVYPVDIFGPQVSFKYIKELYSNITKSCDEVVKSMEKSTNIVDIIDKQNTKNLVTVTPFSKSKVFSETQGTVVALAKILSKLSTIMCKVQGKCSSLVLQFAYDDFSQMTDNNNNKDNNDPDSK